MFNVDNDKLECDTIHLNAVAGDEFDILAEFIHTKRRPEICTRRLDYYEIEFTLEPRMKE